MLPSDFRTLRHRLGLSAQKMALLLGLGSGRTVRRYERGDTKISPPVRRLARVAAEVPAARKALEDMTARGED